MHESSVYEEAAVSLHKICAGETLARILHLRVAEGEPYLLHLARGEEAVDYLDVGAQESGGFGVLPPELLCSGVHARSLDVDSDEIYVGEHARQSTVYSPLPQPSSRTMGFWLWKYSSRHLPFISKGTFSITEYGYWKTFLNVSISANFCSFPLLIYDVVRGSVFNVLSVFGPFLLFLL